MTDERLQQEKLIDLLYEAKQKKESSMFNSVWFEPENGRFLFQDNWIYYNQVEPLIRDKRLVFVGYEKHQGTLMLRYQLPK